MERQLLLTRDQLGQVFMATPGVSERVGIEIECGLVDPETGRSVPYHGENGSAFLLQRLLDELGGEPVTEAGALLGVRLESGAEFSLEAGNAIELSSAPASSLSEVVASCETLMLRAAEAAHGMSVALMPGGILPFTPMAEIPWIPKRRIQIMRDYFRGLGGAGGLAEGVMGLGLSVQTTFDYVSWPDLAEKLRLGILASPVVAAILVNSPLEAGKPSGALSRRVQFWQRMDPSRSGPLDVALDPDMTIDSLIEWALSAPMVYRRLPDGVYAQGPPMTFGTALERGFGDGTWPVLEDWQSHLSQIWPNVRVRRTLETRLPDGPPWPHFGGASALWTGLLYDATGRAKALALLGDLTAGELRAAEPEIAVKGIAASLGRHRVYEYANELLKFAREGLARRATTGLESAHVTRYLDPLDEVLATGVTFAESALARWEGDLSRDAAAYVKAYGIHIGSDC